MTSFAFLLLYVALCVVVHLANRVARRVVEQATAASDALPALDAYQLAVLAGGPQRAVATTTAVLRGRGVLRVGTAPATVALKGHLAADAHALECAVGNDLQRARQLAQADVQRAGATRAELERIEDELTRRGLLVDPRAAAVARWVYVGGPLALLTLGGAWLATHWDYYNDEPMRWVMLITIGVGVVAVEHLVTDVTRRGRRRPTALGRAVLDAASSGTSRSPDEQLALTTALRVDGPAHDAAAAGSSTVPGAPRHAVDDVALLAEELALLHAKRAGDGACDAQLAPGLWRQVDGHVEAQLAGALLTELIIRGRVVAQPDDDDQHATVAVIHRGSTRDDLLDAAMSLLGAPPQPLARPPRRRRVWSSAARRRMRARGIVSDCDLVSWWWRSWTLSDCPGVSPTILHQLLALMEGLGPIHDQILRRLADRGLLHTRFDPARLCVVDASTYTHVRERVRSVVLGHERPHDRATAYLAAMCGLGLSIDPALDTVADTKAERRTASRHARTLLDDDAIARAVRLLVDKHHSAFDG